MAHPILYYKGTVDAFQQELGKLPKESKKYKEIVSSVVYISENFDKLPEDMQTFDGAIFANGAIIESKSPVWEDE